MFYRYPDKYKFEVEIIKRTVNRKDLFRGSEQEKVLERREDDIYDQIDEEYILSMI